MSIYSHKSLKPLLNYRSQKFIDFLGDMIAPAPPPTPDQSERMVRSAEEKQQAHAEQAAHQERCLASNRGSLNYSVHATFEIWPKIDRPCARAEM